MGHRATRRQARQNLVGLKKGQGIRKQGTYIMPDNLPVRPRGPERSRRYSKNTQQVKQVITIQEARQESKIPNPKVHKGKVWKTGYRSSATTMALCPTRSSPLSTGRWAIARPLLPNGYAYLGRTAPIRRYEQYSDACFWRDRLNRLLRRRFNLWYTVVDLGEITK